MVSKCHFPKKELVGKLKHSLGDIMRWFDILKRIEVVPEESLNGLEEFTSAEKKGYPSIIHPLKIVAEFDDDTNKLKGYTSYRDFGKFYFVGNSMSWEKGTFLKVLNARKKALEDDKPRITLLNPIQGTKLARLSATVEKRGGIKIDDFSQVDDIMDESMYDKLNILPMYRYPPYKESS